MQSQCPHSFSWTWVDLNVKLRTKSSCEVDLHASDIGLPCDVDRLDSKVARRGRVW
jgi:hypothetical protein